MREFQAKQKRKYLIYSYPSLFLLVFITIILIKGAVGIMLKERSSAERVDELIVESGLLEVQKARIEEKISRIQTEEGIKEEIKRKFSVTEQGEQVAIIVNAKAQQNSTSSQTASQLEQWWSWFKSLW